MDLVQINLMRFKLNFTLWRIWFLCFIEIFWSKNIFRKFISFLEKYVIHSFEVTCNSFLKLRTRRSVQISWMKFYIRQRIISWLFLDLCQYSSQIPRSSGDKKIANFGKNRPSKFVFDPLQRFVCQYDIP